jgi:transposase
MLEREWAAGCHNGAELWRRLGAGGFRGSLRVVTEWASRRRHDAAVAPSGSPRKCPSARTIAKLMTADQDARAMSQDILVTAVERGVPDLATARDLVEVFHAMVRDKKSEDLEASIATAGTSLLKSFAAGWKPTARWSTPP